MNRSQQSVRIENSVYRPGFELHPIMLRAALATSRQWRDAIVEYVDADGAIELRGIEDGRVIRLWNYLDTTKVLAVGEPVAVHVRFGVLAAGDVRLSVRLGEAA